MNFKGLGHRHGGVRGPKAVINLDHHDPIHIANAITAWIA